MFEKFEKDPVNHSPFAYGTTEYFLKQQDDARREAEFQNMFGHSRLGPVGLVVLIVVAIATIYWVFFSETARSAPDPLENYRTGQKFGIVETIKSRE